MELVFEDISTFDAENAIIGTLLRGLDVGKKVLARELIKQTPGPPGQDFAIRNGLNKLRDRQEPTNNNNNISPLPLPPVLPPHSGPGPFIPPPPPFQPPPPVLIHFNNHHRDLIILLGIFIFLHNFHLQILTIETKDYLEIYLIHRHRLLLEKEKKARLFRIVFKKN